MKHFLFLVFSLPFFAHAQDGIPKMASAKRQFPHFEISAKYGVSLSQTPATLMPVYENNVRSFYYGAPVSGIVTGKISIAASTFISRSVDVGLFYSSNKIRYYCKSSYKSFDGNLADPATRIGFFGRYHYSFKKWSPFIGLGIADLEAQKWAGLSYTASLGVDYRIVQNLYASVQIEYLRDNFMTKHWAISDRVVWGYTALGGLSFRF